MVCAEEAPLHVDMHINDLADFVFLKNVHHAEIYLQLCEVEDTKDLFFFCLDLFCKGLVLLYGQGSRVTLEDLTMEQFQEVQRKLRLAGIEVFLSTKPRPAEDGPEPATMVRVEEHGTENLDDFVFVVKSSTLVYQVHFELTTKRR